MNISVIVPTYNGAHKIGNLLDSLLKQTHQDFELIVVIDGSTDNTVDVLESYKLQFENFRVVVQENQERAKVRNKGARIAKGALLIFFDDDMRPIPACIEKHLIHHQTYINSILVGAQVDDSKKAQTDIQRFKVFISDRWTLPLKTKHYFKQKGANAYLTAANFSINKDQFKALGGFKDCLTGAEDFELAIRARQKNIPIYYWHEAFAWHDDLITCASYVRRTRQYRVSHRKLLELNPELYSALPDFGKYQPKGLKKWMLWLLRSQYWIELIDGDKYFLKLIPKKLRYKLYDLVITANTVYLK